MKKNVSYLFLLLSVSLYGQITYEHTYPFVNGPSMARIQLVDIGNNDYKYIYSDYLTNELKIFNIDHTPFLTIAVPISLIDHNEYNIGYVTKSLFDCDTTMIEYAIMAGQYRRNFYIYRQDGTLLFQRDSTLAPWCFGCFNGSSDVRPIVNTPSGTKLFIAKADTMGFVNTVDVYSLCGSLPQDIFDFKPASNQVINVFPNPSKNQIQFQFQFHDNFRNYELVIYNSTSNVLKTVKLINSTNEYILDNSLFSSGLYYYSLNSENMVIESGKFIIAK